MDGYLYFAWETAGCARVNPISVYIHLSTSMVIKSKAEGQLHTISFIKKKGIEKNISLFKIPECH